MTTRNRLKQVVKRGKPDSLYVPHRKPEKEACVAGDSVNWKSNANAMEILAGNFNSVRIVFAARNYSEISVDNFRVRLTGRGRLALLNANLICV